MRKETSHGLQTRSRRDFRRLCAAARAGPLARQCDGRARSGGAERYRGTPNASTMLVEKLRHGGKAHWGDMPMPLPEDRGGPLSAEDARTLVQWVLSQ